MSGVEWLRPEALAAIALVPVLLLGLRARDLARAQARRGTPGPRAPALVRDDSLPRAGARRALVATALGAIVVAAARPAGPERPEDVELRGVDVVACLDVSRSMLATDVAPSRLGRAKEEIRALARRMRDDRLALVLFAGEARVAVPATRDALAVAALADLADPTSVARGGTDLGRALDAAVGALSTATGDHEAILLVTDGEDHEGRGLAAARRAASRGLVVHAVGMGTARGGTVAAGEGGAPLVDAAGRPVVSALDAGGLRRIAEATGGTYVDGASGSGGALASLYEERIRPMEGRRLASERRATREDLARWPLLLALLALLADVALADRARSARRSRAPVVVRRTAAAALLAAAASLGACGAGTPEADAHARRAVEALRGGDLAASETAATEAMRLGGPAFSGLRDFVRGNAAFARSAAEEEEAAAPGADPGALVRATAHAEDALAYWRMAAASRADWPAARRNVERALLRLERLRERGRTGSGGSPPGGPEVPRPPEPRPSPPPLPDPANPDAPPPPAPASSPEGAVTDLRPDEVTGLLERLSRQEREKAALRRSKREVPGVRVERDW